jgi:hypothetical protein
LVPALLYYVSVFFAVHFEAKRYKLMGVPANELPSIGRVMIERGHMFIPMAIIIAGLVMGYSAPLCALVAALSCLPIAMLRHTTRKDITWMTPIKALEEGARGTLSVAMACACAGLVIGSITITGLGIVFTQVVIELANNHILLALIVMYIGFAWFGANVGGLFSPDFIEAEWSWAKVWDLTKHLPIPSIVLGVSGTAQLIRIMRSNLLDELRKPYVTTARARGLPEYRVIMRYPVRVALNPFVSTIGYLLPYVISGSIIVSLVLSLPTVGPLLLKALIAQDMFLAGTIVLLLGVLTVIGTFISDLLLMWVDPRIRLGRQ